MVTAIAAPPLEFTSAGMVTALALLVACWAVTLLIVGYTAWVRSIMGGFIPNIDFSSGKELAVRAARILLYLTGWALLIIALARSSWSFDVISATLADTVVKSFATLPAAIGAALLTTVIVLFLPRNGSGRTSRIWNVGVCLLLLTVSSTVAIVLAWNFPIRYDNLAMIVFLLGFVPLLICYGLFLIAAVAFGFGASRTHPRAAGINTTLLAIGLAASYVIVDRYGPIPLNDTEEITTAIVQSAMGSTAVAILFIAGILGIIAPDSSDVE